MAGLKRGGILPLARLAAQGGDPSGLAVRPSHTVHEHDIYPLDDVRLQHRGVHGTGGGATDEAKAAAHAGLMIAAKPAFSAISSYWWGSAGDRLGFRGTYSPPPR